MDDLGASSLCDRPITNGTALALARSDLRCGSGAGGTSSESNRLRYAFPTVYDFKALDISD